MEVTVKIPNLASMVGRLKAFQEDQLPYALSVGMNRAAKDAKDKYRSWLSQKFILRSRNLHQAIGPSGNFGGGKMSKNVNHPLRKSADARAGQATRNGWSHKSQWPNLFVVFGSESHSLARQEYGGTKPNVSPHVWIPTRYVQYTSAGKKLGRHTPSKLRRKLATVNEETGKARRQGGNERVFIRNRVVYERGKGQRKALPLYLIRDRATVPPRLDLETHIVDMYHEKLFPRFSAAMKKAIADGPKRGKK